MKVMREKESFKPVTIVLESQDELDWLFCCLSNTPIKEANKTYADEIGGLADRFTGFAQYVDMYEAVRKLMEGEYK